MTEERRQWLEIFKRKTARIRREECYLIAHKRALKFVTPSNVRQIAEGVEAALLGEPRPWAQSKIAAKRIDDGFKIGRAIVDGVIRP